MQFSSPRAAHPTPAHTSTEMLPVSDVKEAPARSHYTEVLSTISSSSDDPIDSSTPLAPTASVSSLTPHHLGPTTTNDDHNIHASTPPRLYKRRFLGLLQLVLLNIVVSWLWLTFAPVSATASEYFGVSIPTINWLSTGFLFAFVIATPASIWTLNKYGPRGAILVSSALLVVGVWLRYAGTRARREGDTGGIFGVVFLGQVLCGMAQPFVLTAPVYYSELWFSEKGRISATAVASLANPFGGALGQLIDPFWATKSADMPNMVFWVSIITSAVAVLSIFMPSRPPTPPTISKLTSPPPITLRTLSTLLTNPQALLLILPFTIYVASFNASSSLLVPILNPHGFSETQSGIAGALLIVVGLLAAAITSPFLDRHPSLRLFVVKTFVPVLAAGYLALIWVPATRSAVGVYILFSVIGATSLSLVPLVLELLVDVTYPAVGAEVSSNVAWMLGQLGGGIWIVVMDALGENTSGDGSRAPRALIWQAVWCIAVAPMVAFLSRKRLEKGRIGIGEGVV